MYTEVTIQHGSSNKACTVTAREENCEHTVHHIKFDDKNSIKSCYLTCSLTARLCTALSSLGSTPSWPGFTLQNKLLTPYHPGLPLAEARPTCVLIGCEAWPPRLGTEQVKSTLLICQRALNVTCPRHSAPYCSPTIRCYLTHLLTHSWSLQRRKLPSTNHVLSCFKTDGTLQKGRKAASDWLYRFCFFFFVEKVISLAFCWFSLNFFFLLNLPFF